MLLLKSQLLLQRFTRKEGETTTVKVTVSDPDSDDMTIKFEDASKLATVKDVVADEADTDAAVTKTEDGLYKVTGASHPVTVNVEIKPDFRNCRRL